MLHTTLNLAGRSNTMSIHQYNNNHTYSSVYNENEKVKENIKCFEIMVERRSSRNIS